MRRLCVMLYIQLFIVSIRNFFFAYASFMRNVMHKIIDRYDCKFFLYMRRLCVMLYIQLFIVSIRNFFFVYASFMRNVMHKIIYRYN